jgi:hypothetical protein
MNRKVIRRIVSWLLLAATIVFIVTGFGITEFRIIERLTFGLLNKGLAFRIHETLTIPYLALLALHVLFKPLSKLSEKIFK